jgi:hypothetical protein
MFWYQARHEALRPRYYVTGLPKSGLHLLACMVEAICEPVPDGILGLTGRWVCTFPGQSFTSQWDGKEFNLWRMSQLQPGQYYMGHCGWYEEMERLTDWAGIAHVFVYRDLRDVAVSQAHHILSQEDRFKHRAKAMYGLMGGFDEVLAAVIEGVGPYTGLIERWRLYAGWLDAKGTLAVKFKDLREDPEGSAVKVLEHGLKGVQLIQEASLRVEKQWLDAAAKAMAEMAVRPDLSPTFREGKTGGWRDAFKDRHKDLFKEKDTEDWLVKLGFEDDKDW